MSAKETSKCTHDIVKCLCCQKEGTLHEMLVSLPRTVTEKGLKQRKEAASQGRSTKDKPRNCDLTQVEVARTMYYDQGKSRSEVATFLGLSVPATYRWIPSRKSK